MRLIVAPVRSRVPMVDCEWGSRMIQLFEQKPRPNRRLPVATIQIGELFGGLVLAAVCVVLAGLLFTF